MKTKYKNLKELKETIVKGDLDGSKLQIILDNDMTNYMYDDGSEDGVEFIVESSGNGYYDYFELYELYFPSSKVEGC